MISFYNFLEGFFEIVLPIVISPGKSIRTIEGVVTLLTEFFEDDEERETEKVSIFLLLFCPD